MECPTNMQAMVDMAKIVDLALLLIDASIGFEMESFEFLCLLHNHGMPNVMGVLTHLDYYKLNKHLRKTKKRIKSASGRRSTMVPNFSTSQACSLMAPIQRPKSTIWRVSLPFRRSEICRGAPNTLTSSQTDLTSLRLQRTLRKTRSASMAMLEAPTWTSTIVST